MDYVGQGQGQVEAAGVGSVIKHFGPMHLKAMRVRLPPPLRQQGIVAVLAALDDKIELNRRMSQTLEAMAQTIYEAWFLDAMPDEENLVTLKALAAKIGSGATPRGGREVYIEEGVALIRSQNVYDSRFVWDGLARITDDAARQLAGVEVQAGDVLLNITGASILRTCVVPRDVLPARVNQHVAIIRAKPGVSPHYLHLHLLQPETKAYLLGLNAGGSREAVTKAHIESVPLHDPGPERMRAFHEAVAPLFQLAHALSAEARTLASLRDALLPRLLNGELVPAGEGNSETAMIPEAVGA
jgi:type I restriction enzyme S subunit